MTGTGTDGGASDTGTADAPVVLGGVVKTFGRVRALDGLDLEIRRGEVHGFLGPNGAGKSTTVRLLLGLARADAGRLRVLGGDPWRDAVLLHRRMAYVPGDVSLWPGLSGGEVLDLLARLHGGVNRTRRAELVERFELDTTRRSRGYSKGNRQKVALVAALASDAELLVLDEPTSGLDPLMEQVFRQAVAHEAARGRTVLLSSHVLSEVEVLCDRVSIIRAGRVIESGTLAELRHLTRTAVTVELGGVPPAAAAADLQAVPGVHDVAVDGVRVRFDADPAGLTAAVHLLGRWPVTALQASPPTLEQLFLRHYAGADPARSPARPAVGAS
ncbi:ABC transporter ATP-binding protein [Nakamurella endophytica]|uniref:ABC transporter ATP-binding protein n=1 Tax=Nakamurella endophytica TaxID=1748367 RepID=A0A917SL04_9ACTN|nr:ABC transporter ATP-binding protein [Nakamurella endophytica]GGL87309.1 ABC transporter ATP-binding protein [Nakamurella endophytica]